MALPLVLRMLLTPQGGSCHPSQFPSNISSPYFRRISTWQWNCAGTSASTASNASRQPSSSLTDRSLNMATCGAPSASTCTVVASVRRHGRTSRCAARSIELCIFWCLNEGYIPLPQRKHSNVFLSLSIAINSRSPGHRELITACSSERILAESDYHDISYSTGQTWQMLRAIAEVKGWRVETEWHELSPASENDWGVVRRLEHNWEVFQKGGHKPVRRKDKRKLLLEDWESDEEDKVRPID